MLHSHSAYERSVGVVLHLSQYLVRLPEAEEVDDYYITHNLRNGGSSDKERLTRHQRAIKSIAKKYDPEKTFQHIYIPGQYINIIQQLINPDDLIIASTKAKYRRKLLFEDCDIVLGCQVTESLKDKSSYLNETVPIKGIYKRWQILKERGLVKRSPDYAKIKAAREALIKAELIILIDETYKIGGKDRGRYMRWELGPNCPESELYLARTQIELELNENVLV